MQPEAQERPFRQSLSSVSNQQEIEMHSVNVVEIYEECSSHVISIILSIL